MTSCRPGRRTPPRRRVRGWFGFNPERGRAVEEHILLDRAAFRPPPSRAGAQGIGRTVGHLGRLGSRVQGASGGWNREDTGEDERAGRRDPAPPDGPEPREDRPEEQDRGRPAPWDATNGSSAV